MQLMVSDSKLKSLDLPSRHAQAASSFHTEGKLTLTQKRDHLVTRQGEFNVLIFFNVTIS